MSQLAPLFLTIHILTAIAAFGPSFAFPLIARMAAREPMHGSFAVRLTDVIEKRMVLPLALTMPISGGLLVWSEGINLLATHWLLLAITLYVIAIVFAVGVQLRTVERMVDVAGLLSAGATAARTQAAASGPAQTAPAQPAPARTAPALAAGPGAALARTADMAGLHAQMARLGARAQRGGILLSLLIVAIVTLMASKPGF
jgi:uncharacterized membrane protein